MNSKNKELLKSVSTPAYVLDKGLLIKNLQLLHSIQEKSGAKILLALKGFSMHAVFPLVGQYLTGITSSSLYEAKLGAEFMGKEVHIYAPAYREDEFEEIISISDHVVFNSVAQYQKYRKQIQQSKHNIECGLRVNPEYSEVSTEIYNPCASNSRLGTKLEKIKEGDLKGISGLHFHTMCEQNSDTLERTLEVIEKKFGKYLYDMNWINFGGGHHITRDDYDVDKLIKLIKRIKDTYGIDVYLEPGEAVALNCGYLVSSVLDIVENGMNIAILDTSAACHMPDVIEMPYRPYVIDSAFPNQLQHTYRFGGMTCLAGDVIGDYSFERPLSIGDKVIFTDMAHYTMVKNNMFNGVNLPSIVIMDNDKITTVKEFSYDDFKSRLS